MHAEPKLAHNLSAWSGELAAMGYDVPTRGEYLASCTQQVVIALIEHTRKKHNKAERGRSLAARHANTQPCSDTNSDMLPMANSARLVARTDVPGCAAIRLTRPGQGSEVRAPGDMHVPRTCPAGIELGAQAVCQLAAQHLLANMGGRAIGAPSATARYVGVTARAADNRVRAAD